MLSHVLFKAASRFSPLNLFLVSAAFLDKKCKRQQQLFCKVILAIEGLRGI
jgi:hypothetical protein